MSGACAWTFSSRPWSASSRYISRLHSCCSAAPEARVLSSFGRSFSEPESRRVWRVTGAVEWPSPGTKGVRPVRPDIVASPLRSHGCPYHRLFANHRQRVRVAIGVRNDSFLWPTESVYRAPIPILQGLWRAPADKLLVRLRVTCGVMRVILNWSTVKVHVAPGLVLVPSIQWKKSRR